MTEQKEVWKPIPEYEGIYEVSNMGRVRSITRRIFCNNGKSYIQNGQIIKPCLQTNGYLFVGLHNKGIMKQYRIHRLVAEAFLTNSDNKLEVNHIDRNKTNNKSVNLEWVDHKENMAHGKSTTLHINKKIAWNKKLTIKEARKIRKEYLPNDRKYSTRALARKYGVSPNVIAKIIRNETYKEI